jgi:hypothetical protein
MPRAFSAFPSIPGPPKPGEDLLHPYLRRGDKVEDFGLSPASPGGQQPGLKDFQTGFGDQIRREEGGIHF